MSDQPSFFVVNPNAANGRLGRQWSEIARAAESALGPIAFRLTERPGHASEIAAEAAREGHKLIVSVGGDGTNNEVVNGLIEDDQPVADGLVLGFIPYGTGGDLRRTLSLTGSLEQHLHRLRDGVDKTVDLGRIDFVDADGNPATRYFLNIASAGISGLVDLIVNNTSKRFGGKLSFLYATVQALRQYTYPPVSVQVDDGPIVTCPLSTAVVANAQYFGGGMKVAPDARMDDGLFDVVISQQAGMLDSARGLRDMYRGEHLRHDFVHHFRGQTVVVRGAERTDGEDPIEVYLDVDGEVPGKTPATFTVLESRLALRVNAGQ